MTGTSFVTGGKIIQTELLNIVIMFLEVQHADAVFKIKKAGVVSWHPPTEAWLSESIRRFQ